MKMKIKSIASVFVFLYKKQGSHKIHENFFVGLSCQIGNGMTVQCLLYQFGSFYLSICSFYILQLAVSLGRLVLILAYAQIFGPRKPQIGTVNTVLDLVTWIIRNEQRMVTWTVRNKRINNADAPTVFFAKGRKSSKYSPTQRNYILQLACYMFFNSKRAIVIIQWKVLSK
jgi:hypothetical protein